MGLGEDFERLTHGGNITEQIYNCQGIYFAYRVVEGEDPEIYADGFTNIIDITCSRDGSPYVLEIAFNSLMADEPEGALIKVDPSDHRDIIADGPFCHGGVALDRKDEIYVTNSGVCLDDGEVLPISP